MSDEQKDEQQGTHWEVHARYAIEVPGPAPVTMHLQEMSLREMYNALVEKLERAGSDDEPNLIDEYFSTCWKWEEIEGPRKEKEIKERGFPRLTDETKLEEVRYRWICVFATTGGSEGHYVHVDLIWQHNYKEGRVPLLLYKTFAGLERALSVAAILSRALEV